MEKSVSIHMKSLQCLTTEIYRVKNGLSFELMKELFIFEENENYDLRSSTHLANRNMPTACFRTRRDVIKNASPLSVLSLRLKNVPLITF